MPPPIIAPTHIASRSNSTDRYKDFRLQDLLSINEPATLNNMSHVDLDSLVSRLDFVLTRDTISTLSGEEMAKVQVLIKLARDKLAEFNKLRSERIQASKDRANQNKKSEESGLELTEEKLTQIMQGIETTMTSIYPTWPNGKGTLLHPKDFNNSELLQADANKFGEYSLNPETLLLPFVKMNPEIKDITTEKWYTDLNDKSRANVTKEILKHYGDKYYLPGLEYFKYLSGLDKDKVPLEFQDTTKWFFFLGSTFRDSDGGACFPSLGWLDSGFYQYGGWLARDWGAFNRVLLLPRP